MNKLRHQLFKILLDIRVVLICRYAAVCGYTVAVLIEFISMEEYPARGFNRTRAPAGLRRNRYVVFFEAFA